MTSKKNTPVNLIIWDKDSKYDIPESTVINSEEEFEKTKWSDFDVVYILAELGWKSRTEFYGFKVAKILRLKNKLTCPIVFCSFLSELQLYNFPESKILRRPGHYFLRLPEEEPQFEEYTGIDEDLLEDINRDLFDKQEFIKNRIHDIKDILVEVESNGGMDVVDILKVELSSVKEVFCKSVSSAKWEEVENELIGKVKSVLDKDGFQPNNLFGAFNSEDIIQFIPKVEDEITPEWPHRRWQVLFIDDKENIRNQVVSFFYECNILCKPAGNAQEAFKILKEDSEKNNLISVIIADYRLYENGDSKSDKWQGLQGPQILKHIHYHPDFKKHYAYAILTLKRNAIKRHISRLQKFHIHWFNKADVLADSNHGFNLFCDRIIEIGSDAFFRKYNTPDAAVWTNGSDRVKPGLSFYYRLHVESFDYEEAEKEIVTVVLAEIENIKKNISLNDNYEYQCSLNYESSISNEVELLKKFRKNILIPRRIIWYLLNEKLKNADEIFEIFDNIKKDDDVNDSEEKKIARKKALYNIRLGISIKLIEWIKDPIKVYNPGMLSEEKSFIENQTGNFTEKRSFITVDNDYIILQNFFDSLPEVLLKGKINITFNKLINNTNNVDTDEIKDCIAIIDSKIKVNERIKEEMRNELRFFYSSKDLYNKINNQNIKEILKKVKF